MQLKPAALLFLLACGLAGCGGTAPTPLAAAGPAGAPPIEAPAPPPTTSEATTPPSSIPPVVTTEVAPVTAPPATRAPATTTPPLVLPTVPPTVPIAPLVAETPAAAGCDPSYPGVCIPPGPPDLDCGDISYRRFAVVGADAHRFDADADGIGCESG